MASSLSQLSALTLRDAGRQVARVAGAQDDPDDVGAYDAVRQVMRRLNAEPWDYLQVRGDDITIYDYTGRTLGQEGYEGKYSLPAPYRDLISAKIRTDAGPGGTPLTPIHRLEWDVHYKGTAGIGQLFISFFPLGQQQMCEILDWPTASGTLELRYFRQVGIPTGIDDVLDLPAGPLETAVIELAKAIVATDKGDTRKASMHRAEGERDLGKARSLDRWKVIGEAWKMDTRGYQDKRYQGWGVLD